MVRFLSLFFLYCFFIVTAAMGDSSNNPTVTITPTASVTEGNSGTKSVTLTVTISECPNKKNIELDWTTVLGSATGGSDYQSASGSLIFYDVLLGLCDKTKTVTVHVIGDTVYESDETFSVYLTNGGTNPAQNFTWGNRTASITIINDDENQPDISIADSSVLEGNSSITPLAFRLTLSALSLQDVTVRYTTSNGSAEAGEDYTAVDTTVTIPAGAVETNITIPVIGDPFYEADETLTVTLSNPVNAGLGTSAATGVILNDDITFYNADDLCYEAPVEQCSLPGVVDLLLRTLLGTLGAQIGTGLNGLTTFTCDLLDSVLHILDPLGILGLDVLRQITIPINHLNDDYPLQYVDIIADNSELHVDLGLLGFCGVDGTAGNCTNESALFLGLGNIGLLNVIADAVLYTMPDMDVGDTNHSIYYASLVDVDLNALLLGDINQEIIYGRYIKNGINYVGPLQLCPGGGGDDNASIIFSQGPIDAVDTFSPVVGIPNYETILKTKVSNAGGYTVDAVWLGEDNITAEPFYPLGGLFDGAHGDAVDMTVLYYLIDQVCLETYFTAHGLVMPDGDLDDGHIAHAARSDLNAAILACGYTPLESAPGNNIRVRSILTQNNTYATSDIFEIPDALEGVGAKRKMRLMMKYIDFNKLLLVTSEQCTQTSTTTSNLPGLPQCLNAETKYHDAFGDDVYNRCYVDANGTSGAPCLSNHHGIGSGVYFHDYGCYECSFGITPSVIASDSFAVRPKEFNIGTSGPTGFPLKPQAERDYNISLSALDYGGAVSTGFNVTAYNFNSHFDIGWIRYESDGTTVNSQVLPGNPKTTTFFRSPVLAGTAELNTSLSGFAVQGNSRLSNTAGAAEEIMGVSYDNVGIVDFIVYDQNWSAVDDDDTPQDCNDTHAHTYICGTFKKRIYAYDFNVTSSISGNFVYLYDFTKNAAGTTLSVTDQNATSLLMSAKLDLNITILGAEGSPMTNYDEAHGYADDMDLILWYNPLTIQGLSQAYAVETLSGARGTDANISDADRALRFTDSAPDTNISRSVFHSGEADLSIRINFNRLKTKPVNPFRLTLTGITVTNRDFDMTNAFESDRNASYYYGRLHAPRYKVAQNSGTLKAYDEIYYDVGDSIDANTTLTPAGVGSDANRSRDGIYWYRNQLHQTTDGSASTASQYLPSTGTPVTMGLGTAATGGAQDVTYNYTGNVFPLRATIRLTAPDWLIYNRYDTTADYSDLPLEIDSNVKSTSGTESVGNSDSGQEDIVNRPRRIQW